MFKRLLIWCSVLASFELKAQEQKILFALEPGADLEQITHALGANYGNPQRLCRNVPYFYCTVQESNSHLLEQLRSIRGVRAAQWNKQVQLRFNSNDPWFFKQEHLKMIAADKAWDFQIGGSSKQGDTIVVAIIDTGIDTTHPDLIPNIWINKDEIPWNGRDDDGTGYIDDYRGWNAADDNAIVVDEFDKARHGTGVNGIAGALGNNNLGVSGILWHAKLMQVVGSGGSEAEVLKAFDYVLTQKKIWLNTKGKKGAFVVSANNSWGIDRGRPEDAPLWCAFYDSLGAYGILTAAATVNDDISVDNNGDLPTTCPSPFIIGVNNVNGNDVFYPSGFGTEHIDIAAPGEASFTTVAPAENNPRFGRYDQFSGTSGAAPQVTATVGMLLSYACDSFLNFYKSNPGAATLFLRQMILNGAESLPSLSGKNATGGRLNILKAMSQMNAWCGNYWGTPEYTQSSQNWFLPAQDTYLILNPFPQQNGVQVQLISSAGRMVYQSTLQSGQMLSLNRKMLPPGVYTAMAVSNSGRSIHKFIHLE
jgi:serine protease